MSDIKKIMVAIAFSEYSQAEFDYAVELALDLDSILVVAHIIDIKYVEAISSVESMGYQVNTDDYIKGMKEEKMSQLHQMMKNALLPKEKIKAIIKVGHPLDKLIKIIKEEDIDLAVVGAKGRTDMEHVLLGSIAEKMIRHSPVPILTFRSKNM